MSLPGQKWDLLHFSFQDTGKISRYLHEFLDTVDGAKPLRFLTSFLNPRPSARRADQEKLGVLGITILADRLTSLCLMISCGSADHC